MLSYQFLWYNPVKRKYWCLKFIICNEYFLNNQFKPLLSRVLNGKRYSLPNL
jgi:hypothetical protein